MQRLFYDSLQKIDRVPTDQLSLFYEIMGLLLDSFSIFIKEHTLDFISVQRYLNGITIDHPIFITHYISYLSLIFDLHLDQYPKLSDTVLILSM